MKRISRSRILVTLVIVTVVSCGPGGQQTDTVADGYQVRVHRPFKVGDNYRIEVLATFDVVTTRTKGKQEDTKEFGQELSLAGVVRVLAVNKNGLPNKVTLTVDTLAQVYAPYAEPDAVPQGEVILAELRDHLALFSLVSGNRIPEAMEPSYPFICSNLPYLYCLTMVEDVDEPTEDEVFPPGTRKKVGDSWPIDGAPWVRIHEVLGLKLKVENIKGTRELSAVRNGMMTVSSTYETTDIQLLSDTHDSSSGFSFNRRGREVFTLPVDVAEPLVHREAVEVHVKTYIDAHGVRVKEVMSIGLNEHYKPFAE